MKLLLSQPNKLYTSLLTLLLVLGFSFNSQAHCDRVNGPVAVAAQEALETGDISKALIWITEDQAEELQSKFEQSLEVYNKDEESQKLAVRYFMETTVRLHREAEGMPFTGLKSARPNPEDIETAETTLVSGDVDPVINYLSQEIREKTDKLFVNAMEAQKQKDSSIKAGREWVNAYVQYIVYIHSLNKTIQAGPAHGVGNR